ncbi:MAG: formimidoylglutamase [Planctomycetes bacterium]|nr:formimidoylglutamase [Planctomycetota bacterium]
MSVWQGRTDEGEGALALRWHQRVLPWGESAPPGVVLLGFACDEGVRRNQGRPGAAEAPKAIRRALANLAWQQTHPVYDAGDLGGPGGDMESAQDTLADYLSGILDAGHRPLVLGGGHETAWGTFLGTAWAKNDCSIGIVNLDAHFDLRAPAKASSGTPFSQMAQWHREHGRAFHYFCLGIAEPANTPALFERARSLQAKWRLDADLGPWRLAEPLAALESFASDVDALYLSIDLDVLPGATMPAVSAPAALGVPLESVEIIISAVLATGKVAAVDLVEYNPSLDADGRSARVAARLVWRIAREWS